MDKGASFKSTFIVPVSFVILLWVIHFISWILDVNTGTLGIFPRNWSLWSHIFTAPLIHGDWEHLISNSVPLLLLGWFLFVSYPREALIVYLAVYLLTGVMVMIFGRSSYHIGASGMVYGMASFLFIGGVIRKDNGAVAMALIVAFLYGGLVWGILPHQPGISWESHLFGGIIGGLLALIIVRNKKEEEIIDLPGKSFKDFVRSKKMDET